MTLRIAIAPDRVVHSNGERQSFSQRWVELAQEREIRVHLVNPRATDVVEQVRSCDGLLWRAGYSPEEIRLAKRVLPAVEQGACTPVFPDWRTLWHFEDKVAQHYLLEGAGIATPRTFVAYSYDEAIHWLDSTTYPFVFKLSFGIQSNNVILVRSRTDAVNLARRMFGVGIPTLTGLSRLPTWRSKVRKMARDLIRGAQSVDVESGYLYAQEFLDGNAFDTRVTVIGNRAYAFRRMNRPGDFRASGSGQIDWDPAQIDLESVLLALRVARLLKTQSLAVDVIRRGEERVVAEISYTYATWAIRDCPGHWTVRADDATGELEWNVGQLRAEDAIFDDFVETLTSAQ